MDKEALQTIVTRIAYNTGFGAYKHFATYFVLTKAPGWIGLITALIGLTQLAGYNAGYERPISITLLFLGMVTWSIAAQYQNKDEYNTIGKELNRLFHRLMEIYLYSKNASKDELIDLNTEVGSINQQLQDISITKQVMFSDLLAHYSFFYKADIVWLEEARGFTFWKDKVPANMKLFSIVLFLVTLIGLAIKYVPTYWEL